MTSSRRHLVTVWSPLCLSMALLALLVASRWISITIPAPRGWGVIVWRGTLTAQHVTFPSTWSQPDFVYPFKVEFQSNPTLAWWLRDQYQTEKGFGVFSYANAMRPDFYIRSRRVLLWPLAAFFLLADVIGLRHARRPHAGRCPACGYDLHALPDDAPCPECGAHRERAHKPVPTASP